MKKFSRVFSAAALAGAMLTPELAWAQGEKVTAEVMKNAGMNTILGIAVVFVMLIIISLIIYAFKLIPIIADKFTKKEEATAPAENNKAAKPAKDKAKKNEIDDLELVAVIAAAIAASEEVPVDSFRVRTIKRRY